MTIYFTIQAIAKGEDRVMELLYLCNYPYHVTTCAFTIRY